MKFEIDFNVEPNEENDQSYVQTIAIENAVDLTYKSFFTNYMLPNIPCLIKGISENWECSRLWITEDKQLNFNYLEENYGMDVVQVYQCQERFYNTQRCYTGSFKDYLHLFDGTSEGKSIITVDEYIKNWHLKHNHPEDNFYEVPIYFASDWLNEFYINCLDDDYRFVYMGSIGTWTPFHSDVFSSYSWSANVYGKKRWLMVPAGEEQHLKDHLGNLPYDLLRGSVCSNKNTRSSIIPNQIEIIQNTGEAFFVPSNWHHQVHNLDYSISVNHNWVNGCNIKYMYEALVKCLADVKEEIEDCSDMDNYVEHCQLMLNSLFGMDYKTFYQFLLYIATKRMEMFNSLCSKVLFHGHEIGNNHIIFDLKAIKNVLENFIKIEEIHSLSWFGQVENAPQKILDEIVHVLEIYHSTKYQM